MKTLMNRSKRYFDFFCVILLVVVAACGRPKDITRDELIEYLNRSAYSQSVEQAGVRVTAFYKPTDLLVVREIEGAPITPASIDQLRSKYDPYFYFKLSFTRNGEEVLSASGMHATNYSELLNTLSFRMKEYLTITTEGDTADIADYTLERTFGLANSTDLLIAVEKESIADDGWIQINIAEFGLGLGRQALRFDVTALNSVPKLDYSKI